MITRQDCYTALFKLKNTGIDITEQLNIMQRSSGIPNGVLVFLRDNSPQFQFYRYIQKHQKALAENLLDYKDLDDTNKIIVGSSFITRVYIAIKYKNISEELIDELNLEEISDALHIAILMNDFTKLDNVLEKHSSSLKMFYKNNKEN